MNLTVPYTDIAQATRYVLSGLPVATLVDVSANSYAYRDHLQDFWNHGETFINMEHDVVPWPGAIEEIAGCEHDWCVFAYEPGQLALAGECYLGLAKFSSLLIRALPDVWRDMADPDWQLCDSHLYSYAGQRGVSPHQHFPPVVNANPRTTPEMP